MWPHTIARRCRTAGAKRMASGDRSRSPLSGDRMPVMFESWAWSVDWVWGLPLIVVTVLIHVLGLVLARWGVLRVWTRTTRHYRPTTVFVTVIALMTLLAASLLGIEATLWALAYRVVGALPDDRSAMLYSLNALTSYGHTSLRLDDRWHLMGAIEALNGQLLFGLSTAFLFAVIARVFASLDDRPQHNRV